MRGTYKSFQPNDRFALAQHSKQVDCVPPTPPAPAIDYQQRRRQTINVCGGFYLRCSESVLAFLCATAPGTAVVVMHSTRVCVYVFWFGRQVGRTPAPSAPFPKLVLPPGHGKMFTRYWETRGPLRCLYNGLAAAMLYINEHLGKETPCPPLSFFLK